MKKLSMRFGSIVLSLLILISICSITVSAETQPVNNFKLSNEAIRMIQRFEGFALYPVWDYAQYSVGYGSRCPDEDYDRYMANGITYAEADALLRNHIKKHEYMVNNFANQNNLILTQHQFDALVSFSYNVGGGWMNDDSGLFTQAVLESKTGNDFIFAMTRWCTAGGKILTGLVNRRLCEANLYLNGEYSNTPPENYKYVIFNHKEAIYNGEEISIRLQAYDAAIGAKVVSEGYKQDYRFLGWYTAENGMVCVDVLDDSFESGQKLYAKWQDGEGNIVSNSIISGTISDYSRIVTADTAIYKNPTIWSAIIGQAYKEQNIKIVADYVNKAGVKWGRIENNGWIDLTYTNSNLQLFSITREKTLAIEAEETESTQREVVGFLIGADINIYETLTVNGQIWGNTDLGWLCLEYIDCVLF